MITATLLNNMEPEHALNALRADLPDDLIWLVDWVERLRPSEEECAILEAVEAAGFSAANIAALAATELGIENLLTKVQMIKALDEAEIATTDQLGTVLTLIARLDSVGIDIDALKTLMGN